MVLHHVQQNQYDAKEQIKESEEIELDKYIEIIIKIEL
jgi:hypothetical protein